MKKIFFICSFFACLCAASQSPYLSVKLAMDTAKYKDGLYKIEMKICEPKIKSDRGDWFTADSSGINFLALKPADIVCENYFETEKGNSGTTSNQFNFSNQVFAWEKLLIFRLSLHSSKIKEPAMFIVMPVKYKAFVTSVNISDVEFQPGKLMFITEMEPSYKKSRLSLIKSLKGYKTSEVKDSPLKTLLEEK